MEKKQALTILNLNDNDHLDEKLLKKTYRKLSMIHHPDKQNSLDDIAEKNFKFAEINEAYNFLLDLINLESKDNLEEESEVNSSLIYEIKELKKEKEELRELNSDLIRKNAENISEMNSFFWLMIAERVINNLLLSIRIFFANRKLEKISDLLIMKWLFYFLIITWLGYRGSQIAFFIELSIAIFKKLKEKLNEKRD